DRTTSQGRQLTLNAIDNFKVHYPDDRRTPRLLVEGATICDDMPEKKRELLLAAKSLSKEEELNLRITDDLRRLDMLDKPISLTADTIQGGKINLEALRGKIVAIVFWAADSVPCQLWIRNFRSATSKFPNSLVVVAVSLDTDRTKLENTMKTLNISWPTNFDGKGWENPIARRFGINALPTLWLLDRQGRLRTLNARDNYELTLRQLVQEK
ncbi:MAG: TlpA disulfide reductase family protein, partial [Chthoniobacterales bacterium]